MGTILQDFSVMGNIPARYVVACLKTKETPHTTDSTFRFCVKYVFQYEIAKAKKRLIEKAFLLKKDFSQIAITS